MLPFLILTPLAVLVLVNLPLGNTPKRLAWPLALLLCLAQSLVVAFVPAECWTTTQGLQQFFGFNLGIDNLTRVLLLAAGIVATISLLVAHSTVSGSRRLANFASVVLIALMGMNGTVLVRDLFSLWLFLEVTAVGSFVLIAFDRSREGLEGAFKYIVLSAVATMLMVGSIGMMLLFSGGTSFAALSEGLKDPSGGLVAKLAVGVFVCGLFIKGGLVPFHGWLPGAYSSAPSSTSVLLAGVVTKASGIYALVRLVLDVVPSSPALSTILLVVGALSAIVGALGALYQTDMKRLLSYSSISQVGYILLGLGCGSPLGIIAAVFHLFNHAIFKSLLFVNAAAVNQRVGTTDMTKMGGLGVRMPWTSVTSILASLSNAGVPPLAGFWSKLLIVIALWQTGHPVYAFVAVGVSVMTLGYLLWMQRKVFFGQMPEALGSTREAAAGIVISEVILAAITVGVGVFIAYLLGTFLLPMTSLF